MAGAGEIEISEALSREALAWVERLKSGRMTAADGEVLQHWRQQSPAHIQAFAEAVVLMRLVREACEDMVEAPAFNRRTVGAVSRERRLFLGGMAAASAAAVGYLTVYPPLALWPSLGDIATNLSADYTTGTGERRNVKVANVAVEMNTQTGLSILSKQPAPGIELIHGEAAIETNGTPFLVNAGTGHIAAKTAQFNVRYDGTSACVTCVKGALRLVHSKTTVGLSAGEQLVYTADQVQKPVSSDAAIVTAWRRGMLTFHNETLSHVVTEVNRYRKGRIVILKDGLAQKRVYANFHLDKIDTIVDQMQRFSHARVLSVGDVVFLS